MEKKLPSVSEVMHYISHDWPLVVTAGYPGLGLSYLIQENTYEQENVLKGMHDLLAQHDLQMSVTSYFGVMSYAVIANALITVFHEAYLVTREAKPGVSREEQKEWVDQQAELGAIVRSLSVPLLFGIINTSRELFTSLHPEYIDNFNADIVMGWLAVVTMYLILLPNTIKKIKNKSQQAQTKRSE